MLDFDGHVLVHPTLKGQHAIDLQDIDGKMFYRTMIASAQNNGKGWEDVNQAKVVTMIGTLLPLAVKNMPTTIVHKLAS